jgi:pimeloyl-ACP methyl ester carboxylesterase
MATDYSEFLHKVDIRNGRVISLLLIKGNENLSSSRDDSPASPENFASDTTIFFYHGAMGSWRQFEDLIANYRGRYNIVAYDALGCGDSEKPADPLLWPIYKSNYTMEELAQDAVEVFAVFANEKNILIGHSFGTAIIARVINSVNESLKTANTIRPRSLSTELDSLSPRAVAPHPRIVGSVLLGTHMAMPLTRHPIFFLPVFVLDSIQSILSDQFVELAFSRKTSVELKEKCKKLSQGNKMHVAKAFYSQFTWASESDWTAVAQYPVCICQGQDDMLTPLDGSQALFQFIVKHAPKDEDTGKTKNLYEVICDAGHQVMQEKPEQLIKVIEKFLSDRCDL